MNELVLKLKVFVLQTQLSISKLIFLASLFLSLQTLAGTVECSEVITKELKSRNYGTFENPTLGFKDQREIKQGSRLKIGSRPANIEYENTYLPKLNYEYTLKNKSGFELNAQAAETPSGKRIIQYYEVIDGASTEEFYLDKDCRIVSVTIAKAVKNQVGEMIAPDHITMELNSEICQDLPNEIKKNKNLLKDSAAIKSFFNREKYGNLSWHGTLSDAGTLLSKCSKYNFPKRNTEKSKGEDRPQKSNNTVNVNQ